jgi:hypothetical protein
MAGRVGRGHGVSRPAAPGRLAEFLLAVIVVTGAFGALLPPLVADANTPSKYLVVAGRSIGRVSLGERQANVEAISGPGTKINSRGGDIRFYKHLQLVVNYGSGRVALVQATDLVYGWTPGVALYQTKSGIGVNSSFNTFAARYPHRRCRSASYMGGTDGNTPYNVHQCIVVAKTGNWTVFSFTGPAGEVPDCNTIGVGVKSRLAAEESAPLT